MTTQRPFPRRRSCCPAGSSGTTAASDALPARAHFPGSPVIGRDAPTASTGPPGRGGPPQFPPPPSDRSTPHTPGSSSGPHSRLFTLPWPSPRRAGLGASSITFTTRQASLDAGPVSRLPQRGARRCASTPAPPRRRQPCYRASWQPPRPDSHRQATTSLSLDHELTSFDLQPVRLRHLFACGGMRLRGEQGTVPRVAA